ncbi:MAG: hypothetical protein IH984_05915 [Planctomycetes bacterium]|nr:hypothetical protein [Planctomycetota bacterium]
MNAFFTDATYNLNRAAALLDQKMDNDQVEDATMQFAFGIERIFKGIIHDVNPLLLLESAKIENAISVLYRDKMIPKHREKADKEARSKRINSRLLSFQGSMLRAAKFSNTTELNIGLLTKLSHYRGIIAHRKIAEFDHSYVKSLILRVFHPIVTSFAAEIGLDLDKCFATKSAQLYRISESLVKQANFQQSFTDLLKQHAKIWEQRSGDENLVATTMKGTQSELVNYPIADTFVEEYPCPACENPSILFIDKDWDVDRTNGEAFVTGIYVSGLECRFCDLELNDYEQFDYLELNEWLVEE